MDAGVIVAALDAADAHHAASVEALRAALASGARLLLPTSAYAECLVWPCRAGEAAVRDVEAFIDALPAEVVAADRETCRRAARLRAEHRSLRLPDALVIAAGIIYGADKILTTDGGWPQTEVPIEVVGVASTPPKVRSRVTGRASRTP